ncbi:MAG: glycosyl transferase, partial [bacterium]
MTYFAGCFLVALLATLFIIRSTMRHGHLSADHDLSGPQKFHGRPVPRVGGAGVMVAIVAGAVVAQISESPAVRNLWLLIACSLPAFCAGIAEDLTKNVSPRRRLFASAVSAGL